MARARAARLKLMPARGEAPSDKAGLVRVAWSTA
jgi:hypothetical protein